MSDLYTNLPRVRVEDLPLYDHDTESLSGFLKKQAGQSSTFSKGKLQRRFFVINYDLQNITNYTLSYYYYPNDKSPRQVYELKRAAVILAGGLSFRLEFDDGSSVVLAAESKDEMNMWIKTLEKVISVATTRDRILNERKNLGGRGSPGRSGRGSNDLNNYRSYKQNQNQQQNQDGQLGNYDDQNGFYEDHPLETTNVHPFQANQRRLPTLRIEYDSESIPPASTQRRQFIEFFVSDLSKALRIHPKVIEVVSVKPAPNRNQMTLIEFDINLFRHPNHQNMIANRMEERNLQGEQNEDGLLDEEIEQQLDQDRYRILYTLHQMVSDTNSILYRGTVTSKLDSSYSKYLIDDIDLNEGIELISPIPTIQSIMNKYKDVQIGLNFLDITHFIIYLSFEGYLRPLKVPNPLALPRRDCAIYQFEIKQCLGLTGTLQELWIEPISLIPKDMPKALSQPIVFEPSARLNGAVTIHASRLKADLTYNVQCEDYRGEVLRSLSGEEIDSIKATFDEYDANGDGSISKHEMEELIRQRTQERIDFIEDRFQELLDDPEVSDEDIDRAKEAKQQHLQHLEESKTRMIKMFDAADVNGDGTLSFTEFMLMEAWWLRCTLNPMRAHLF